MRLRRDGLRERICVLYRVEYKQSDTAKERAFAAAMFSGFFAVDIYSAPWPLPGRRAQTRDGWSANKETRSSVVILAVRPNNANDVYGPRENKKPLSVENASAFGGNNIPRVGGDGSIVGPKSRWFSPGICPHDRAHAPTRNRVRARKPTNGISTRLARVLSTRSAIVGGRTFCFVKNGSNERLRKTHLLSPHTRGRGEPQAGYRVLFSQRAPAHEPADFRFVVRYIQRAVRSR